MNYYEEQEKRIRERFQGHVVREHEVHDYKKFRVEYLSFGPKNDNSWSDRIDYYLFHNKEFERTFIYTDGDLREATFRWYGKGFALDKFDKSISLAYFSGKCISANFPLQDWDEVFAKEQVAKHFADPKNDVSSADKVLYYALGALNVMDSRVSWERWLDIRTDEITEIFGERWERWLYDCGNRIPFYIHAYLIGLKMAGERKEQNHEQ